MSEPAGTEGPIEEFELEIFRALDRYFEVRRSEVEESIERAGTEFKNCEQARLQPVAVTLNPDAIATATGAVRTDDCKKRLDNPPFCRWDEKHTPASVGWIITLQRQRLS